MRWKAVEEIDDALNQTRELLFPFKLGLWIKLTFLTFITGSGLSTAFIQTPLRLNVQTQQNMIYSSFPNLNNLILAATGVIMSLSLLFMLINSIAEFALFKTLLTKKSKLWDYFRQNVGRGLRYMAYRLVVLFLALLASASSILVFSINPLIGVLSLILLAPLFVILAVSDVLIRDFVLLEMLENEQNFIKSIESIYEGFRPQWKELMAYLVVRLVLTIAIAVGVSMAVLFTGLMFAVFGLVLLVLMEFSLIFVLPLIGLTIVATTLIIIIAMPFQAYLYNYKIESYKALKDR